MPRPPCCMVARSPRMPVVRRDMGFSVKIAPGVRVRASSRGIRTSIGPRAARLHVGGGRTGFSTGGRAGRVLHEPERRTKPFGCAPAVGRVLSTATDRQSGRFDQGGGGSAPRSTVPGAAERPSARVRAGATSGRPVSAVSRPRRDSCAASTSRPGEHRAVQAPRACGSSGKGRPSRRRRTAAPVGRGPAHAVGVPG